VVHVDPSVDGHQKRFVEVPRLLQQNPELRCDFRSIVRVSATVPAPIPGSGWKIKNILRSHPD